MHLNRVSAGTNSKHPTAPPRRGEALQEARTTTAKAAKKLQRMGLSRRDTADVLGISHQRVQQLLAS